MDEEKELLKDGQQRAFAPAGDGRAFGRPRTAVLALALVLLVPAAVVAWLATPSRRATPIGIGSGAADEGGVPSPVRAGESSPDSLAFPSGPGQTPSPTAFPTAILMASPTASGSLDAELSAPVAERPRSESVYVENHASMLKVAELTKRLQRGGNVTVVAFGGSATAGAGCAPLGLRYYTRFARSWERLAGAGKVSVVLSGHGGRNTYDGAMHFDSYVPSQVDLILWEFAINDKVTGQAFGCCSSTEDVRFESELWFNQVALHPSKPAVMIVYLWESPFQAIDARRDRLGRTWGRQGALFDLAPYHHSNVRFGSIVGHVALAERFHERGLTAEASKHKFLADTHHPNCVANDLVHEMMISVLRGAIDAARGRAPRERNDGRASDRRGSASALTWPCGTADDGARKLRKLVFFDAPPTRSVSWTSELPRLETQLEIKGGAGLIEIGESTASRLDRKISVVLPKCPSKVVFDTHNGTLLAGKRAVTFYAPISHRARACTRTARTSRPRSSMRNSGATQRATSPTTSAIFTVASSSFLTPRSGNSASAGVDLA